MGNEGTPADKVGGSEFRQRQICNFPPVNKHICRQKCLKNLTEG